MKKNKTLKNVIQNWIWKKWINFKFQLLENKYLNNKILFHNIEQDKIRTIKNSFEFASYRTKNKKKMINEYESMKKIISYRLTQLNKNSC